MLGADEFWPVYHHVFLLFFTDSAYPVHFDRPFCAGLARLLNPHLILLNKHLSSKPTSMCWMLAVLLCFWDPFSPPSDPDEELGRNGDVTYAKSLASDDRFQANTLSKEEWHSGWSYCNYLMRTATWGDHTVVQQLSILIGPYKAVQYNK